MSWLFPTAKERSRQASNWARMVLILAFPVSVISTIVALSGAAYLTALYTGFLSVAWVGLLVLSQSKPRLAFLLAAGSFATVWPAGIYFGPEWMKNVAIFPAVFSLAMLQAALFCRSDAHPEVIS